MKNTIPKKLPVLFSQPKKIPASFIDPKKSLLVKMSDPSDPPIIKIFEWGPWGTDITKKGATEGNVAQIFCQIWRKWQKISKKIARIAKIPLNR